MYGRLIVWTLSMVLALLPIARGHADQPAKTVAKEQAFYEALPFGLPLQAGAVSALLDPLSDEQVFAARLFRKIPGCLGAHGEHLQGSEVTINLSKRGVGGSRTAYQINVVGVDFAGDMSTEGDHINVQWYHCNTLSHSLHATPDQKHFLFKLDGQPMLAWSVASN
jgi:hypothetical protein